jgi:hypothetical protein
MITPKMHKNKAAHVFVDCLPKELGEAIVSIANEIRPIVQEIHSFHPTTQNYYGDYLRIMSYQEKYSNVIEMALLIAGADPKGVQTAHNIIKKIDVEVEKINGTQNK